MYRKNCYIEMLYSYKDYYIGLYYNIEMQYYMNY